MSTPGSVRRIPPVLRRIPFTLALALTLFVTTTVTGTLLRSIRSDELARWGFGAADLAHGHWLHLVLATFQIIDPYVALSMLATVLALVGACEYRLGTVRTVPVYALAHVAGWLATMAVAKIFAAHGSEWGTRLVAERDVGASAGAIGALGAWLMYFPPRLRAWSASMCAVFLAVAFGGDVHAWDVAHAAAFVVGVAMGDGFRRYDRAAVILSPFMEGDAGREQRRLALAWIAIIVGIIAVLAPFTVTTVLPFALALDRVLTPGSDLVRWLFFFAGVMALGWGAALRRGERRARQVTLLAGVLAVVGLWQPGVPGVEHVLAILLVAGLIVWRRDFREAPAARSLQRGSRVAAVAVVSALGFALFGFAALREHFVPPLGLESSARMVVARLRFLPIPTPNWHSPGALWFLHALPVVLYGSVGVSAYALFRSGIPRNFRPRQGSSGRSGQSV